MNASVKIFFIFSIVITCVCLFATEKVNLGGLRQVTAEITNENSSYRIKVSMLPVKCFTPLINESVNADLAATYALSALAKYSGKKALAAKQHKLVSYSQPGGRYIAVFRTSGISEVSLKTPGKNNTSTQSATTILAAGDLLSRKKDWINTLETFYKLLHKKISLLDKIEDQEDIDNSIIEIEDQHADNCKVFLREIEKDIQLLSIERNEIIHTLNNLKKQFYENLKKVNTKIADHDSPASIETYFSDIQVESGYKRYLEADLNLMKLGGARLFRIAPNKYFLVTIGSATVKGNTPRSRIKQRKIAEARAVADLLKMTGVKVSTLEISKEKITVVKNGNKEEIVEDLEEYLKIDQEDADGWVQMLPEIGSWYSKDKNTFYISLGKFFVISN